METTKSVLFLSNMILQPIKRELPEYIKPIFADIDSFVQTLNSSIESDYIVIVFDTRFFYDLYIDEEAFKQIDFIKALLKQFRQNNSAKIIIGNLFDRFLPFYTTCQTSQYHKLLELNMQIEALKEEISDIEICNIFALGTQMGYDRLYNDKNRFLFQSPFTKEGIKALSKAISDTIQRFESKRKKVIVLDADNTLWGGIVGEDGVDGVAIDENYPGIAYKRFQLYLKSLKESGLVLAMVSKNNQNDVKELFEKRSMPLGMEDFVTTRINWLPKSQNIKDIADELNLGLESFLFVDDNPFEIEEVKNRLGIDTLLFDKANPLSSIEELSRIQSIHAIIVTQEDKLKSQQYKSEKARSEVFKDSTDIEEFIKSLNIEIEYWINNTSQIARITQLVNKTNQFNLTTKRYSQAQIEKLMSSQKVFSFRVKDRFGDMGIVGVAIIIDNTIDTLLLSCRVLGRGIEDRIMDILIKESKGNLNSVYIPSAKNMQVENLYDRLGFELIDTKDGIKYYKYKYKAKTKEYIKVTKGE